MAKPIRALELHYPMIQFSINRIMQISDSEAVIINLGAPSASVDSTLLDLHISSHHTQRHSIIVRT